MSRFIRWKGLIAFVVIVSLMAAGWFLLADILAKRTVETVGTKINGAKLELSSADLSLFPLGLVINGLQVTDRDEPMKNLVQAERAAFLMEPGRLLMGKVMIDEMTVDGLRFGTDRKKSGALTKEKLEKKEEVKKDASSGFDLSIKDPKKILEKEKLESLEAAGRVSKEIEERQAKWKSRIKDLPDDSKISAYEKRVKEIEKQFKGGIAGALQGAKAVDELKRDIEAELKTVSFMGKEVKNEIANLESEVKEFESLPKKDLTRLKEKYGLSLTGAGNYSNLLLGGTIGGWIGWGTLWYGKTRPYLERMAGPGEKRPEPKPERLKGVDVRFKEFAPAPDFFVKVARISAHIGEMELKGTVEDISSDQRLTGRPLTFSLTGSGLGKASEAVIDGEVSTLKGGVSTRVKFAVKGYDISGAPLSGGSVPVDISKGKSDMTIDTSFSDKGFDSKFDCAFRSINLASQGDKKGKAEELIAKSLSGVNGFSIKGHVKGMEDDYKMEISSDLEDILKKAVMSGLRDETARFEKELERQISEKTSGKIKEVKDMMQGNSSVISEITGRQDRLDGLLKSLLKNSAGKGKFGF